MTVKELIAHLQQYPPDTKVYLRYDVFNDNDNAEDDMFLDNLNYEDMKLMHNITPSKIPDGWIRAGSGEETGLIIRET